MSTGIFETSSVSFLSGFTKSILKRNPLRGYRISGWQLSGASMLSLGVLVIAKVQISPNNIIYGHARPYNSMGCDVKGLLTDAIQVGTIFALLVAFLSLADFLPPTFGDLFTIAYR